MVNIVKVEKLSYTYPNGVEALKNVSMRVEEGEILGIIGPNGAGKSTLLMIIDLLYKPSEGVITLFGTRLDNDSWRDKDRISKLRRRIGFVFQDPDIQLFSNTVREDISFSITYQDIDRETISKKVDEVLELLGISHLADRHPYDLSYGERRIAAIATILPFNPDIILLDEPTSNLDAKNRERIIDIISKLNKIGKTIVIASHDLPLISLIADRIYLLNKTIILEGKPSQVVKKRDILIENGVLNRYTGVLSDREDEYYGVNYLY